MIRSTKGSEGDDLRFSKVETRDLERRRRRRRLCDMRRRHKGAERTMVTSSEIREFAESPREQRKGGELEEGSSAPTNEPTRSETRSRSKLQRLVREGDTSTLE